VKDRIMKFSGMIDLSIGVADRGLTISAITSGHHLKWKKKSEFLKVNISNQNLYYIIKPVFKCSKQLTPPEVEVSTSGYFRNKFQILNFQCLKSSLLLQCFTWNWYMLCTLGMSKELLSDFEKVTSGHELWSWEIQTLLFHFLRNGER
jgi:hypothetical protein